MFYAFTHKCNDSDLGAASDYTVDVPLPLTAGVIHQVDILFQDKCDHLVEVQIFQANFQLWPSNRGAVIKGNATVVSFREFLELVAGGTKLTARIKVDISVIDIDVVIQIGLLPKKIIQPLSFEELLSAATGIE